MPDPGDIIGQAVVNVRTCTGSWPDGSNWCGQQLTFRCPGCRGDGTWLDTDNATTVERLGCEDCKPLWRPVENGDTGDGAA